MATTKKQNQPPRPSHASLDALEGGAGYDPHYKDVIKEGIVHEHSRAYHSLSEMYAKYPANTAS